VVLSGWLQSCENIVFNMNVNNSNDPIRILQNRLGEEWPSISKAIGEAEQATLRMNEAIKGHSTSDVSVVVYGSLARKEWTSGSDVDWTLLIDGEVDPQHLEVAQSVADRLNEKGFVEPGQAGVFGNMTFSHDLVQKIGGKEDSNENTTRRVLLLQESMALGNPAAYDRVLTHILKRYLTDDRGFRRGSGGLPYKVPRFMLNDIVRYWRTITVDFVEKQRGRAGQGYGLRNAKLRMSRKLIFAAGLLSCFSCEFFADPSAREELINQKSTLGMEKHLGEFIRKTPLEILAITLMELKINDEIAVKLFSSYDAFLAILDNRAKRDELKRLHYDDVENNSVFQEVRVISRRFQEGLTDLFFKDNDKLRDLTVFYGVF